ncbi:MAG TPA: cupin domain-containing protein [Candidatus Acidoferrum sp.]|jgi:1,2-dihydroxy-3-keto-5-methylthiopentene dioxygenase
MATVHIPDEKQTLTQKEEICAYLSTIGITYEQWQPAHQIAEGASAEEVLAAYAPEIDRLKREGGYVAADVIDVMPTTPGLDAMLNRFNSEHWHDEDEVRFIIEGRGLFHIHPREGNVISITVEAGDLLRVPRGTWHWFDLCQEKRIRAIRLFQDASGWTPHYTESGTDRSYEPVCFGPSYISSRGSVS